jgi:hypothetical protein
MVLSLAVLTVHTFRRLPWPSTISVGADYSPSTFANYSLGSRWLTFQTNCFATPTPTPPLLGGWLQPHGFRLSSWLQTDSSLRNSCLKVGEGERYSRHLLQLFIYALKRVGYRGDVCCPFTMHSSGFILGTANRYHAYIASPLSGNGTELREICYTGSPLHYVLMLCPCLRLVVFLLQAFSPELSVSFYPMLLGVQVMKPPSMQFCSDSWHFFSLRSKYSPQCPVLRHSQFTFYP